MHVDSDVEENKSLTTNPAGSEPHQMPLRDKIQDLQRFSNVVQALENLITQCDGLEEFEHLKLTAIHELLQARRYMAREISLLSRE